MADQEISYGSAVREEKGEEVEVKGRSFFDFMKKKKEDKEEDQDCGEVQEEVLVAGVEQISIEEGKNKKNDDEVKFYDQEETNKKDHELKFYEEEEEKKDAAVMAFGEEKYGEEKKESLFDKLHSTHSSSSSSSDEEEYEEVDGEKLRKKKKKKGLKEKIKEKLHYGKIDDGRADQEVAAAAADVDNTDVVVEKVEGTIYSEVDSTPSPNYQVEPINKVEDSGYEVELYPAAPEEKKGFFEKIKEKLPGHHNKKAAEDTTYPPPAVAKETIFTPEAAAEAAVYPLPAVVRESIYPPQPGSEESTYSPPAVVKKSFSPTPEDEVAIYSPPSDVVYHTTSLEETTHPSPDFKLSTYPSPAVEETAYTPAATKETDYAPPTDFYEEKEKKADESIFIDEATEADEDEKAELQTPSMFPDEEKKGFLEKIKEKLPGVGQNQKKPVEDEATAGFSPPPAAAADYVGNKDQQVEGDHGKDQKKGIFGKIMEKLPGYN